jgi:hypothetical protein
LAVIDEVSDSRFAQSTKSLSQINRQQRWHSGKTLASQTQGKGLSPAAAYAATGKEKTSKSLINKLTTF